jgi:hypothetical protein
MVFVACAGLAGRARRDRRRPAGSAERSPASGTAARSACSTPATGQLLCEHRPQRPGGYAPQPADESSRTPPTTLALLARAARVGAQIGALCEAIHRRDGASGVRRILGIVALIKKYGPAGVDDACAAALECGATPYRFVGRYLERHLAAPLTLRQVDPLIRGLTHYRAVIAQKTQEVPT